MAPEPCLVYALSGACWVPVPAWALTDEFAKVVFAGFIAFIVLFLAFYIPWVYFSTMADARAMRDTLAANRDEIKEYNRRNEREAQVAIEKMNRRN